MHLPWVPAGIGYSNGPYLVEGLESEVDQVMIKGYRTSADHLVKETFGNRESSRFIHHHTPPAIDLVAEPYEYGEKLDSF